MGSWIEYTEPEWRGLHFANLTVDQAYLWSKSHLNEDTWLYLLSEECYMCPFTRTQHVPSGKHKILKVDVSHRVSLKIFNEDVGKYAFGNETSICDFPMLNLGEFGVYNLSIGNNGSCNFVVDKKPVNIYLPLLFIIGLLMFCGAIIKGVKYAYGRYTACESSGENEENHKTEEETNKMKKRLRSLDTFRGMTIVLMIFVNSGSGHYWWMEHAPWNGLHLADIVFPSFLWIMGVCIPISIKSQLNRGVARKQIIKNIVWRSVKLFSIGVCLNSLNGPKLEDLRIMGVLQRFGIAYLICAFLHTVFSQPQSVLPQNRIQRVFHDIILMKFEWMFAFAFIALYLVVIFSVPAPGCPRGYLGPGGKHDMALHPYCIGGIIGFIDKAILSVNHIYQHPTAKYIYDSTAFDPEGVFGCILTVVQVLIGVQCGVTLTAVSEWKSRIARWLTWSIVLGLIGSILCCFSKEDGWIPVNKNLWSLSFVLITSCISFAVLTICYFVIDVKPIWSGSPFREAGMNSIVMYVGHSVFHKMLPWHWKIGSMNTHFMLLLESVWNTVIWMGIAIYLYKKEIFYNL